MDNPGLFTHLTGNMECNTLSSLNLTFFLETEDSNTYVLELLEELYVLSYVRGVIS